MNHWSLKVPGHLCKFILPEARKNLTKENKYFSLGIRAFIFKMHRRGQEKKVKCPKLSGIERKKGKKSLVIKIDLNLTDNLKQCNIFLKKSILNRRLLVFYNQG